MINRFLSAAMTAAFVAAASTPAPAAKIERVVTPRGLEVWHVRDDTLPMVSMEFAFRGGSAQDPADKSGLATMAAALLDEGAGDLDARAFQERLEERAVVLNFNAQRDSMRGSLHPEDDITVVTMRVAEPGDARAAAG